MNINDEAVEAAAKGLARHKWPTAIGVWESFGQGMEDDFRDQARAALEAAAPHMQTSVSTIDALVLLKPGTVIQGPDFHEETYKCTAPGTFHGIAAPTEYRPSELVGRGPFTIIYRPTP